MSDITWRDPAELTTEMVATGRVLVRMVDGDLALCLSGINVCNPHNGLQQRPADGWLYSTRYSRKAVTGFVLIDTMVMK